MKTTNKPRSIFGQIGDPRSDINKLHKLEDILLIGIIFPPAAARNEIRRNQSFRVAFIFPNCSYFIQKVNI